MKTKIYLLAFCIITTNAVAQNPQFYKGAWSTVNQNKTTVINSSGTTNHIYRISNGAISSDITFDDYTVIVDGQELPKRFMEGGSILVEGKKIEIRQNGTNNFSWGVWEIIQNPTADFLSSDWTIRPDLNKEFVVADLKISQEFHFSVNSQSTNCNSEFLEVLVDGVVIKDKDNRVVQFAAGSTFLGNGKRVTIRAVGNCTGNGFVSGAIWLKKVL